MIFTYIGECNLDKIYGKIYIYLRAYIVIIALNINNQNTIYTIINFGDFLFLLQYLILCINNYEFLNFRLIIWINNMNTFFYGKLQLWLSNITC